MPREHTILAAGVGARMAVNLFPGALDGRIARRRVSVAVATALAMIAFCQSTVASRAQEQVSCLHASYIRQTQRIDTSTIDFVMTNRTVYRNTLPRPCPGLKRFDIALRVRAATVCRGQPVRLVGHGGTCVLGWFVKQPRN